MRREVWERHGDLLALLMAPEVGIGTSTPLKDPSGDYAWQLFENAGRVLPGADRLLADKAQKLVGGGLPTSADAKENTIAAAFHDRRIDVFLGYASGLEVLQRQVPDTAIIPPPPDQAVTADYGATVIVDAAPHSQHLVVFLLSDAAQAVLGAAGFGPPRLAPPV